MEICYATELFQNSVKTTTKQPPHPHINHKKRPKDSEILLLESLSIIGLRCVGVIPVNLSITSIDVMISICEKVRAPLTASHVTEKMVSAGSTH